MWSLVFAAVSVPAVASPPELDVEGPPVAPGGVGLPFVPPVVRKLVDVPHGVVNGTNASAGEYEELAARASVLRNLEKLTKEATATHRALYEADGYWRGPIWAPSTVLIEDGLRRAGHTALADTISERFRHLCETSGFAENFDARTGAGQRDRAYTWTASAYLILSRAAER